MASMDRRAHPTPPKSPNHRDCIRDVSPEMAAEYDAKLMRGVEMAKSPGPSRKSEGGSSAPLRSTR